MGQKKIIVSVTNDLSTDQRVHKVCVTLQKLGFEVTLVGRLVTESKPLDERPYATRRFKLWFEKGALFYANFNLRLFFYLLFQSTDVLLANDLDTLLANTLASKLKGKPVVYDSHEYFTEVPELVSRPKVQRIWERIERFCFKHVKHMYTVNDSIAGLYHKAYGKNFKVVRNIPQRALVPITKTRQDLELPEDRKIIILQGAWINVDRGGEEAVRAMQFVENALLIIVGGGDVIDTLKAMTHDLKLEEKVWFFGKRPYSELVQFTANADLGLSLDKDTNINYRYSLPNKVFDYIHAETAVLASNLVEVARVVTTHQVGEVLESHDPKTMGEQMQRMLADETQLQGWKANAKKASVQLTWENEAQVLREIYADFL